MVYRGACDECTMTCRKLNHEPNEQSPKLSRFFKLMFGKDYTEVLYLPPEFARTVRHLTDLETQIEDGTGELWSVTLSKVKGSLAFQKGWPKFFKDHGLKQGELVIFEYIKGSHFFAQIYGKSATERFNFNIEMPRQNKKPRRDLVIASEDEPFQTADVNSGDKPTSATPFSVGSEFQTPQTNVEVKNADSGSKKMEDPICMINRNDGNYQGADRQFLDLSNFEMQNRTSDTSKFQKVLSTNLDPSGDDVEQTKTTGDDDQMGVGCKSQLNGHAGDMFTDKLEEIKITDQIKGHSGDTLNVKSEKALETDTVPFRTEITKQTINKGDMQKAVTHSSQTAGHSTGINTSNFFKKPSENRHLSKGVLDDVSSVQNGTSNIAKGLHAIKSAFHESSVSSSFMKGKHAIKKERMEMENEGKEPAMMWNCDQMLPPEVKVEPDLYDIGPSVAISPFSVEVKYKSCLELPAEFPPIRGRKAKGRGKLVYLQNSIGWWPVLYPLTPGIKALTSHWEIFCEHNNIKAGDKCRFSQVENENGDQWVFRVDVDRNCGESPHK